MILAFALAALATPEEAGVDRLLAAVNRSDGPGCAIDVRADGRVLVRRAYGMADLEGDRPNTPETVFEAGSVSKQFVGALIALLAESGRLSLDDSVRRWLPELPPLYQNVTVGMLLHHTSGVRNWDNLMELSGWPEGTRVYTPADALAAIARQRALNNAPGAEYLYSNSNYVLAALIVARASGQSFDDFSRTALFAPLGMAATRWRSDYRDVVPLRAQAYTPDAAGRPKLDMPFGNVVGPGSLLTTVGDLQRWQAVLDHPAPDQAGWVRRLTERALLPGGISSDYGLGLELGDVAGQRAISHAGATAGYRAWAGRFPERKMAVALLCNAGALNTEELGPQLAALFLPAPAPAPAPAAPAADTPLPQGVAGLYRNLANDQAVQVTADGAAIRFAGGAPFLAAADDRLATRDGRRTASLVRGPDGAVRSILLSRIANAPARLERVEAWSPGAADLAAFAGAYSSPDAEGVQTIAATAQGLEWTDPHGGRQLLTPTYRDGFWAQDSAWWFRFRRDAQGRVIGMDLSITRARRIAFDRLRR